MAGEFPQPAPATGAMPHGVAAPWPAPWQPRATRRAGPLPLAALAAGLPLVFALLLWALFRIPAGSHVNPAADPAAASAPFFLASALVILAALALAAGCVVVVLRRGLAQDLYVALLLGSTLALVFLSLVGLRPVAALYALLMLAYLVFGLTLWRLPPALLGRVLAALALLCCGFLVLVLLVHSPPAGRWYGGMHPNALGQVAAVAALFAAVALGRLWLPALGLTLFVALAVSSRFALVAIGLVALLRLVLHLRRRLTFGAMLALAPVALLFVTIAGLVLPWRAVLLLDDPVRGVASGFTGRSGQWALFWPQLAESPLLGHGFRDKAGFAGTHSGFLNLVLETGIVYAMAHAVLLGWGMLRAVSVLARDARDPLARFVLYGGALVCVTGVAQPQLVNFGDVGGIAYLMLLAAPAALVGREARQ